jgi:hypothetical protein
VSQRSGIRDFALRYGIEILDRAFLCAPLPLGFAFCSIPALHKDRSRHGKALDRARSLGLLRLSQRFEPIASERKLNAEALGFNLITAPVRYAF